MRDDTVLSRGALPNNLALRVLYNRNMKRLIIGVVVMSLTFAIGLFSNRATNRAIDYWWPDADLPELEHATIVTVNPEGYVYSVIFCGKDKAGRRFTHHYISSETPIR